MTRIGFVGTENSHVQHFIRFLNTEGRHSGVRAAALAGGQNDRNAELAEAGEIDLIVDQPEELIGKVDAAIVATRDGARHRAQAEPLLRAGMPVLVDKPLATTVEDAQGLIDAAQAGSAMLTSASALRFVPEITEFTSADRSALRHLHVVGPADPDSEYSGLFFYGIHHIEIALEILGNPELEPGSITARTVRDGDTTVAHCTIDGVQVTFTFVVPGSDGRVPFHATAVYTDQVRSHDLTLGGDYNAPALAHFIEAAQTGTAPLTNGQLLAPVMVLAQIVADLGGGAA